MNKEILRLAIPNIISNISVPLLSTVDTALMGRLSELHIGAVGLGAMIFNFIYWNFGFLRMGTTGMTAQAFGKQNAVDIALTLGRAILIVLVVAILLLSFQFPISQAAFYLMNVSEAQMPLVTEYFHIRIWAAPASLGLFAFMGWFFGMQNAVIPLIITVIINLVNILLNFLFVVEFGMEVDGVAWSTVIAQYVGLILAIILFFYNYAEYVRHFKYKTILVWEELREFLRVNQDIFIRTVCLTLSFGIFYSQSASSGTLVLAANVILLQLVNWMSYGVDGFAFAAESLIGKYHGANDEQNTHKAIRHSFGWGMGLAVLFTLIYGLLGTNILQLYTNQVDVLNATFPYIIWLILFPIISTPCYIWDGIYIGLTASKAMRNAMLLAFTIFIIATYGLQPPFQNHGLWAALLIFMAARGGMQYFLFLRKGLQLK